MPPMTVHRVHRFSFVPSVPPFAPLFHLSGVLVSIRPHNIAATPLQPCRRGDTLRQFTPKHRRHNTCQDP
jgi:hypothetical protein